MTRLRPYLSRVVAGLLIFAGCSLHADDASPSRMPVSVAERAWLDALPVLNVTYDDAFAPFVSANSDGLPEGISADYFQHVVHDLGLKVRYVRSGDLSATRKMLDQGQVDIVLAFNPGGRAGKDLVFSQPYIEFPLVIATRQDTPSIAGLTDLAGERVAADTDREAVLRMLADAPRPVHTVTTHDGAQALELLNRGKVDAVVGNLASVDLFIRSRFPHLRVGAPTALTEPLAFAVRRDYARLVPLINRSIDRVDARGAAQIRNTWLSVNYTWGGSWSAVWQKTWPIVLIFGIALAMVIFAWVRLRREVRRRRHSEQQLQDVTRNLPAVVFRFVIDRQGEITFLYVDGDTKAIFGVDPATFLRDEPSAFRTVSPGHRQMLREHVHSSVQSLEPLHTTVRVHGDRWVTTHALPRRLQGGVTQFDGYWVDVTVTHEQGLALAAARDEAESATQAKTVFLATMSHEIRTPMYGVLGTLELLGGTRLDEEQRSLLGTAGDSATLLLQVLDDVLDFSMIEAGRLSLEIVPVDMRELIDRTVGMLAGQAHGRGIDLRVSIDAGIAAMVLADDVRVRQVLLNLIGNAIKFTSVGSVTIQATVAPDDTTGERQRICVEIIDTGVGIAAEVLPTLFAPFTQGEGSTRRRFGGSGLGLSICHQLVQLMGGTIQIQSTQGAGTCVRVELGLKINLLHRHNMLLMEKTASLDVDDAFTAQALAHGLQALGMGLVDPGSATHADVVFTTRSQMSPPANVVLVSPQADPRGFSQRDGMLLMSACPVKSSLLAHVCELALGLGEASPALPDKPEAPVPSSSARILVADDNPTNQALIRAQLARLGRTCTVVDDGGQAMDALTNRPWDLVILDVHMPVFDGYTVARQWREREVAIGGHLPIVAMTANAQPEEVLRCRSAGMDGFIAKPAKLADLRRMLDTWLPETASPPPTMLDYDLLRENFGSDAVAARIAREFSRVTRSELTTVMDTLETSTLAELRLWLHRTVGGMHVFGNTPLTDRGDVLEQIIDSLEPAAAHEAFATFGVNLRALLDEIDEWTKDIPEA
ncbi:ATP-binding protein [Pinirhizobacter sp.]|jgi:two-component system sensor histidine kinase EvgS|uniref:ATP-binding protein n=1 Tax=Pinirhizobacter sp. TaxID=2950432 RepID=UPI002F3F0537